MKKLYVLAVVCMVFVFAGTALAADVVPDVIMMPGTQPKEVSTFDSPDRCDNCHGGYDSAIYSNEPAFGWRGSAMGNAGRDPIFWATLAIAEQDFDGAGDLCIRCHSAGGWIAGRSTPTDGSGLQAGDDDGVDCDTCHKATSPNNSEHLGVMNPPFIANQQDLPGPLQPGDAEGYYGSGMLSIWGGADKLGPYNDVKAKHQWMASAFHRGDICGSCHDVSNSAVGQLAPNAGTQDTAPAVIRSSDVGFPLDPNVLTPNDPTILDGMAAFNNPPYAYGIVERTFSEWKAGALDDMDVQNFPNLPGALQAQSGALNMAYQSALLAGGTYLTPAMPRTFSCQSCHMRPDVGEGCNKAGTPTRSDLPKHDFTGGNYWVWPLIKYQDAQGTLRLGGGLTATQLDAIDAGQIRAEDQLKMAASLTVSGDTVTITNLTGHKLITGYPEGRRMWLNIKWYDSSNNLLREDGAYGPLLPEGQFLEYTDVNGVTHQFNPESILDLAGTNTKIYEVHPAITHEWAVTLAAIGHTNTPIGFNRLTGAIEGTIGELGTVGAPLGPYAKSFHFALNNYIADDNRIPPYGMDYETARVRNALPVPDSQFGGGTASYNGLSNVYKYWDEVTLSPPTSPAATYAEITLYYQGTSWEYVQFLWLANTLPAGAFLADEGKNYLDAWVNTGMVPPFVMATATWGSQPVCTPTEPTEATCNDGVDNDCDGLIDEADPDCVQPCVPVTEGPFGDPTCNDGLDNDCDGLVDGNDPECQPIDCSVYTTRNLCNAQPVCRWDNKGKVCVNQ